MRFIIRILLMLIGVPLLIIPTLYAANKNLNELPWGFNKAWGNDEDGWNGNGTQRRHWNADGSVSYGKGLQGWWPDELRKQGIIWNELSFISKWWQSYKWVALRNPAWNARNLPYISTSVDVDFVYQYRHKGNAHNVNSESKVNLWYDLTFDNADGKFEAHYRHKRIYKNYFLHRRWGWKVYPELLSKSVTPKFKNRSVYIFQVKLKKVAQ